MEIETLISTIDSWLKPQLFRDYCPNGLQVAGTRPTITSLACAVTASAQVINRAIEADADALLVHHGIFWKGDSMAITGAKRQRIAALIESGVHLIAYHLPLDAHPTLGNNVQLAHVLGLTPSHRVPDKDDALLQFCTTELSLEQLASRVQERLHRQPLVIGDSTKCVAHVAICTGGGQSFFERAIENGADVFITGEVSEQNYHQAQESGVGYIAAGHHATERYGVQALADALVKEFAVQTHFIDEPNPV